MFESIYESRGLIQALGLGLGVMSFVILIATGVYWRLFGRELRGLVTVSTVMMVVGFMAYSVLQTGP